MKIIDIIFTIFGFKPVFIANLKPINILVVNFFINIHGFTVTEMNI